MMFLLKDCYKKGGSYGGGRESEGRSLGGKNNNGAKGGFQPKEDRYKTVELALSIKV